MLLTNQTIPLKCFLIQWVLDGLFVRWKCGSYLVGLLVSGILFKTEKGVQMSLQKSVTQMHLITLAC